ncbi:MAG: glycosyltransferase [Anaerolineaceae bacterium]|nr:glycosyltransferase [Anaerolineaceae bacterium]
MKSRPASETKVLLVGYIFPDQLQEKILNQQIPPIQTHRFGLALLAALCTGFNDQVEILSTAPLLDYPQCKLLFAPRARWKIDDRINARMVSYVNIAGIKHLTRFSATLFHVIGWIIKNRGYDRIIIFHGVQSSSLWAVLSVQFLGPCTIIPFLTDYLGIPQKWESAPLKKMRVLDLYLMKRGLQKVSGVIVMASKLADELAPGLPKLVVPTIQNTKLSPVPAKSRQPDDRAFTIVYTGGLSEDYGINLLLAAFEQANNMDWRLLITGWGDLEKIVSDFAANNPRAQFLGFLKPEELSNLYNCADVLVNPKLTSTSFATMSFPSKIVEYLGTGKPVISTNLPVYDDCFRKHLILTQSDSPEELIRCLNDVSSWNDLQIEAWRVKTLDFVNTELSPKKQGVRIRDFSKSLLKQI